MGLVADTPIVTAAEVAGISGEAELADLDDAPSGATVDAARAQATNFLIDWLVGVRSVDPAKVANPERLKRAAAYHAAWIRIAAQPGDDYRPRAERLEAERDKALAIYVYVSSDAPGQDKLMSTKGLPRVVHTLKEATFSRPIDNENPYRRGRSRGPWTQK